MIPTTVAMAASGFKPAFRRVQQSGDLDCAFAVVEMIVNTALEEVCRVAIERFDYLPWPV